MPNPNFLAITANMIAEVRRRGLRPVAFVMNRATQAHVAEEMWQAHKAKMSALAKAVHRIRHGKTAPRLEMLHGLGIMDGPHLQDGAVFLQSIDVPRPMGMSQENQQAAPVEFWKRDPVAPPAEGEAAPTLNDLSSGGGERPSCSDVLIRALDSAEGLSGVAVIRVHRNGNIDLCANIEKYALQGVIQHAQMWVIQNG